MWIEIRNSFLTYQQGIVTPYAGVWIEIFDSETSHLHETVTPYAGVWIEIGCFVGDRNSSTSHSLRGSVD